MDKWLPTKEFLAECFTYDPQTGLLVWKNRPAHHFVHEIAQRKWNARFADKPVGTPNRDGHIRFPLNRVHQFTAHRVIWFMMTGEWPAAVDHKNGNPADNRWNNLREATNQQNQWNKRNDRDLPKGVSRTRYGYGYWARAYVLRPDGSRTIKHLGTFDTPAQAHAAWCAFVADKRGEFFRAD